MPLTGYVLREGSRTRIFGWEQTPSEWATLKRESRQRSVAIEMGCCGAPGIAKTSSLGMRFFAHSAGSETCGGGESREHRATKRLIIEAARAAGWDAEDEVRVLAPGEGPGEDEHAIVDVLATGPNGTRVAFEVQRSKQAADDYVRRQERYRRAGVRAAWFVSHGGQLPLTSRDLPVFRYRLAEDDTATVIVEGRQLPLEEAVLRLLRGGLRHRDHFFDSRVGPQALVRATAVACQACSKRFGVWSYDKLGFQGRCGGRIIEELKPDYFTRLRREQDPPIAAAGARLARERWRVEPATLEERRGRTLIGNRRVIIACFVCPHCGKSNDSYQVKRAFEVERLPWTLVTLPEAVPARPHWCLAGVDGCCDEPERPPLAPPSTVFDRLRSEGRTAA